MKILVICFAFLLSTSNLFGQKVATKINRPLKRELHRMERKDQKWRKRYIKIYTGKHQNDTTLIKELSSKMKETDSLNYFKIRNIFQQYGYPNYDLVGSSGELFFWLLVQHQDHHPQFQDSVLTAMKIQVDSGKATGILYAYLLDRVKVNTGLLQVYGTQTRLNADSTSYEPIPVVDPEHLNERRKSVGLGSIEKYIEGINKEYMRKPQN